MLRIHHGQGQRHGGAQTGEGLESRLVELVAGEHHDKAARVVEPHHAPKPRRAAHPGRQRREDLMLRALSGSAGQFVEVAHVQAHHGAEATAPRRAPENVFDLGQQRCPRGQASGGLGAFVQPREARQFAVVPVSQEAQRRSNQEVGQGEDRGGQPGAQAQPRHAQAPRIEPHRGGRQAHHAHAHPARQRVAQLGRADDREQS
ncbi:hypothetical protein FQZ97_909350 [compost metagenome]